MFTYNTDNITALQRGIEGAEVIATSLRKAADAVEELAQESNAANLIKSAAEFKNSSYEVAKSAEELIEIGNNILKTFKAVDGALNG